MTKEDLEDYGFKMSAVDNSDYVLVVSKYSSIHYHERDNSFCIISYNQYDRPIELNISDILELIVLIKILGK